MTPDRDTPIFNLKAVVQETGIKADTLRAWERRYGIPSPQRTGSGHRLYSQNDMEMLHWMQARLEEGLSISRAVELWARLREDGPVAADPEHLPLEHSSEMASRPVREDKVAELRDNWIDACLRFDEAAAEQTLAQAFALFPPEVVCIDLIQSGLAQIGHGWYLGRVTVQQEHFASALALRRLEALIAATPHPTRPGRILIGCPPDEAHTFVPLLISLLLRRRGWDTVYLGANVPVASMEATMISTRPSLVILAAQQLRTAASLLEIAHAVARQRIPLAFGGLIFKRVPELVKVIPGHYLGERIDGVAAQVQRLMADKQTPLSYGFPSQEARAALAHFGERRARIEAAVWRALEGSPVPVRLLAAANEQFSSAILASLTLGSLEHLSADMEWIEGLLLFHVGMPGDQIRAFLNAYLAAAESELDSRGRIVTEWLAGQLHPEAHSYTIGRAATRPAQ